MRVISLNSGTGITEVVVVMMITRDCSDYELENMVGVHGQRIAFFFVLITESKLLQMPFICVILQNLEDEFSLPCCGLSLLDSLHPLQWVKCSLFLFQSMFPVRCLMLCNSFLRVLQSPSHLCSVYPLAYHQNVSVSRQAVFVKSFVIILRPPLGNAPRHLYKYVLLRVTLFLSVFAGRFRTCST